MTADRVNPTGLSDGIEFINKNDAGGFRLRLIEEIPNSGGPDAYKHFHKLRSGNVEERDIGFSRHRTRQKSLPRSRRADEQNSFGELSAQRCKFFRRL